jgi:LPS sulfotransferase NodH
VAGNPESYFREPDETTWAVRWKLPVGRDGTADPDQFLRAALNAGRTPNGVFGARVMWGSLKVLLAKAPPADGGKGDLERLTLALGPLRFIHLVREDVVGQAVSWARAEQTTYWKHGDMAAARPTFDREQIATLAATIRRHNDAWVDWLGGCGITALEVRYENLVRDLSGEVTRVLAHVGVELPRGHRLVAGHQRQADALTAVRVARYKAEER